MLEHRFFNKLLGNSGTNGISPPSEKSWAALLPRKESQHFSSTRTLWDGALPTIFTP